MLKHETSQMPVGARIEVDGRRAEKTRPSDRDPWPWTHDGVAYSDEWAARALAGGGRVVDMPHATKMAKDLPVGADVYGRGVTYTKERAEGTHPWVSDDGHTLTDGQIDMRLADGAFITRVPTGTHTKEK